jgi:hypothetical protein
MVYSFIGPPNGPVQRPKTVRYVQHGGYEATARSAGPPDRRTVRNTKHETRKLARVRVRALALSANRSVYGIIWDMGPARCPCPASWGIRPLEFRTGGKNGHLAGLARANGATATDGPYCSPTWPGVLGRRCEPLAGQVVGLGAELHQRPLMRCVGRGFFNSRT